MYLYPGSLGRSYEALIGEIARNKRSDEPTKVHIGA